MVTNNFTFLSNDGKTAIHAVKWLPDSMQYHAILQITHGMIEYIERYAPFAEFLTSHGYMVVGHDHLGHGQSINTTDDWGYFAEGKPSDTVVADIHKLRTLIQADSAPFPADRAYQSAAVRVSTVTPHRDFLLSISSSWAYTGTVINSASSAGVMSVRVRYWDRVSR